MLQDSERVKENFREIGEMIQIAESEMSSIREHSGNLDDVVVEKVHDPTRDDQTLECPWSDHRACCGNDGRFHVQARRFKVAALYWVGESCGSQLHGFPRQVSVTVPGPISKEDKDKMITVDDWITLVGKLVILVEDGEGDSEQEQLGKVISYMQIPNLDLPKASKRTKRQSSNLRIESHIMEHRLI